MSHYPSLALFPRLRVQLVLIATLLAGGMLAAQQPAPATTVKTAPLTQKIPVDPLINTRLLPNGLRYYVRVNRQPAGRAELRLAIKAGSVLEEEDQRGLAHFVEHMAFNGTRHFPKQDVVAFMQRLGMRFGAHVNAQTGFDDTVYSLQIPTADPAVVDRALLALEDWASAVTFDPAEVERERGVILEEWRLNLGAGARIQQAQMPVLLGGSRYADRLPIGRPEIIKSATAEQLKKFYTDWYRPDLMAVVAVGDFDPAAVEAGIVSHFGKLPASITAKPVPDYGVPNQPGTRFSIVTDKEMTATTVGVFGRMPARDQSTVGAYRQQMVERLFGALLSNRLGEIADKPGAPFLAAETSRGLFVRTAELTVLNALVADGGVPRGLTALLAEVQRVIQFGFTQTELDRQKLDSYQYLDQALVEREKSPSAPLADEFIRNFMNGEPIPGIVYEQGLSQRFLPEITLAEVNAVAKSWVPDGNRAIAVAAPEAAAPKLPNQTALTAAIAAANDPALTAYVDRVSAVPLLEKPPAPGKITSTTPIGATGVTEWRLSNGARVVLKPTTFKEDEILFRAISPGGTSLASDADFIAATTADDVVSQGGLGALSRLDVNRALAGVTTAVRPNITDTEEGLQGGSTKKDLETMFKLLYLTFTAPRADREAFTAFTGQLKALAANREAQPEAAFESALASALTRDHPRARPLTPALIDQMSLEKSLAFYKERFADASDFTFVFVGSFDLPTIQPLVERYVASLPSIHRKETARDLGMTAPEGVVEKSVVKGIEPKSEVALVFNGPFQNTQANRVLVTTMVSLLSGDLHQRLREELGGTYGVSAQPGFARFPRSQYTVSINFACDPARMQDLIKVALQVIATFRERGPSASQLADARLALGRDRETNLQQNGYLLGQLTAAYESGENPASVFDVRAGIDQLTAESIQAAAKQYLNLSRYVLVTLSPERK